MGPSNVRKSLPAFCLDLLHPHCPFQLKQDGTHGLGAMRHTIWGTEEGEPGCEQHSHLWYVRFDSFISGNCLAGLLLGK